MIAKQFLITRMVWAILGGLMSVLFRLQLGYPDQAFPWLEDVLGRWAKGGKITAESYYALVTMHGTVLPSFALYRQWRESVEPDWPVLLHRYTLVFASLSTIQILQE